MLIPGFAPADTIPGLAPSLKNIAIPYPPGLLDGANPIVIHKGKAVALGKALFWDMAVGSDGVACATCHFHAGADARTKNQLAPSKAHVPGSPTAANAFDATDERGPNLANYQLTKGDFPLHRFGDPSFDAPISTDFVTLQNPMTSNVVSSAGTFSGQFRRVTTTGQETCTPLTGAALDQTFNVGGIHTRRVEPRNAPTIINSVLFDRNFWDGRASFVFNGVSSSGERDTSAFVWEIAPNKKLVKSRLALENASFASVAVAPVVNEFEMSCRGRGFKDVARKLLNRRALKDQRVDVGDSVLGPLRFRTGKGLRPTYLNLIKQSFDRRYWSLGPRAVFGKPAYSATAFSQAEANFSMFFGLAVQLYASTLISDDSPFDRADLKISPPLNPGETVKVTSVLSDANGALDTQQMAGLKVFVKGLCNQCHSGPLFSSATNRTTVDRQNGQTTYRNMVIRQKKFFEGSIQMRDEGYFNNAAVPSAADAGLGNVDELDRPLAFTEQYLAGLAGRPERIYETLPAILACQFQRPFTTDFPAGALIADSAGISGCTDAGTAFVPKPEIVSAALGDTTSAQFLRGGHVFKTPQLYNVELTGPYMHNGGMATLRQAIESYSRGGNFGLFNPNFSIRNGEKAGAVVQLRFSNEDRDALVAFLKALTDERVRYERAPFDHPQLSVPNGHPGNHLATRTSTTVAGQATDEMLVIPAVGANGRTSPLPAFEELLPGS